MLPRMLARNPTWKGVTVAETAIIEYCAHDLSLSGAEGPIAVLGRWPILWTCDGCGATVLDQSTELGDSEVEDICEECGRLHYPHEHRDDVRSALVEPDVSEEER